MEIVSRSQKVQGQERRDWGDILEGLGLPNRGSETPAKSAEASGSCSSRTLDSERKTRQIR